MFLAPAPNTDCYRARTGPVSDGVRGVYQTIQHMRAQVREGSINPSVRGAAISITYLRPERDICSQAVALYEYVRDHIRYIRDVNGIETLTSPDKTMELGAGDCDDQSTLLAALAESIGIPARFVVTGYSTPNVYEHVYAELWCDSLGWIGCDPTESEYAFGDTPPNPVAIWRESVDLPESVAIGGVSMYLQGLGDAGDPGDPGDPGAVGTDPGTDPGGPGPGDASTDPGGDFGTDPATISVADIAAALAMSENPQSDDAANLGVAHSVTITGHSVSAEIAGGMAGTAPGSPAAASPAPSLGKSLLNLVLLFAPPIVSKAVAVVQAGANVGAALADQSGGNVSGAVAPSTDAAPGEASIRFDDPVVSVSPIASGAPGFLYTREDYRLPADSQTWLDYSLPGQSPADVAAPETDKLSGLLPWVIGGLALFALS